KTAAPDPDIAATEEGLKRAEDEAALATTTPARERQLRTSIAQLRAEGGTFRKYSFLIGATDPFIVVPGAFTHAHDPVKLGDYALVVFGDSVYPAMVGDVGPNDKVGGASLRIAKQINATSKTHHASGSNQKLPFVITLCNAGH